MKIEGIKERVLDAIRRNGNVPIYKIAKEANVSVATASKYCYVLQAENKIRISSFGNMKLVSRK